MAISTAGLHSGRGEEGEGAVEENESASAQEGEETMRRDTVV